ncbi:hypothetical protein ACH5RR_029399 [Cinchona calisaya]|uniref:Aminotransferase-like plant mobile domain-containing protein n=1 Tax=Cinchona calisaya TaxID=153742 RepID=A0ABD2YRM1_9GENT
METEFVACFEPTTQGLWLWKFILGLGVVDIITKEEKHGAFVELGVDDVYQEDTYLAALISCWICIFALPIREMGLTRPGTFVTASLIAEGIRVCLVVPVLASIYRGLNGIANSSQPGKDCHAFLAHYVYVWLAQYFNTHKLNPPCQPDSTMAKFSGIFSIISFDEISEHSEELPASVLERMYQLYHPCTRVGTKSKVSIPALSPDASVLGSKVDAEAIAMDEGTSSQKRCARQEVQGETPIDDHPSGHPSQQPQLDEMSNETPRFKDQEDATLDGLTRSDNSISGPSQFELVARNEGKASDLTHFQMFAMLFRAIDLDGFNSSLLRTRVENLMTHISKYHELHNNFSRKLTETTLSMRLAAIQRQIEETSSVSKQKLKHLESIQAKRISLKDRKVELMKELEQLEVKAQWVDAKILKVIDKMSRDQYLMAHLATDQTNLKNTPVVSSKDSEDLEEFHISVEEERAKVAQLKWMD